MYVSLFTVANECLVAVRYTEWPLDTCLKHVQDSNKRSIEGTARQVGYLPELYKDVRSEKH